jgi:hypothetical protein
VLPGKCRGSTSVKPQVPFTPQSAAHCSVFLVLTGQAQARLAIHQQHITLALQQLVHSVAGSIPDEVVEFFSCPSSSSRTVALGLTQPLTEMSAGNIPGGRGRPALKADNLIAICEPIV